MSTVWERSTTRRLLRWLVRKETLRRMFFLGVTLVTLVALFYAFENWRGKRAWRAYEREFKAQHAVLDFRALLPPEIPDASNFAAIPFLADLFEGKPSLTNINARWPGIFEAAETALARPRVNQRQLTDLAAWQAAFWKAAGGETVSTNAPAQDILARLKPYEAVLEELHAASSRPNSRYLVHYDVEDPWGILLPHLMVVKRTAKLLALKTSAELAAGNVDAAFQDLSLHLRLVESLHSEPFVISHIARIAVLQLAMQTLWEGMALERWSDAQLAQVQKRLEPINFVADLQRCLASEQAAGVIFVNMMQREKHRRRMLQAFDPNSAFGDSWFIGMFPIGWFDFERRSYLELFQTYYLPPIDATNRVVKAALVKASGRSLEDELGDPWRVFREHRFFSRLLLPALGRIHSRTAEGQAAAHQAIIACALERYRHKKGQLPPELGALVPELLAAVPVDPVNGGPMQYRAGDSPRIYSVGWNASDDGGTPGRTLFAADGDRVWSLPKLR